MKRLQIVMFIVLLLMIIGLAAKDLDSSFRWNDGVKKLDSSLRWNDGEKELSSSRTTPTAKDLSIGDPGCRNDGVMYAMAGKVKTLPDKTENVQPAAEITDSGPLSEDAVTNYSETGLSPGEAEEYAEIYNDATKDDSGGSAHISPEADNAVTLYLIPILVMILGLFWRTWDKSTLTKILIKIWSLCKDIDNFFDNPDSQTKTDIERYGIHAAKKRAVVTQIPKVLTAFEQSKAVSKFGSLGNAVEVAINTFKIGVPIVKGIGSFIKGL